MFWRQPVGFIIFWIAALAECERLPFDLPEAEEEIVAGYQTEYSGMKFGLFYLGSYVNLVLSALFVAILYLGGWEFPISIDFLASSLGISETTPLVAGNCSYHRHYDGDSQSLLSSLLGSSHALDRAASPH